jgi:DNA-binding transcriptional LysR family regulator
MNQNRGFLPRPVSEYDLRLLRIFKVVVECRGFSAAEGVLNITRSTISIHISNLEARLKVKLATRGRKGFALTEHGRTVYEASLTMFDSLNDFAVKVQNLDNELTGDIVVLCSDQVALTRQLKLPAVIAYLNANAPKLLPTINTDTLPNIEQALLSGVANVGIVPDYRQIDGLLYQQCYSETFYLCAGKEHFLFDTPDSQISDDDIYESATVHPGADVNLSGIEQFQSMNMGAKAYQFDTRTPLILSGCYLGFFPLSYIQGFLDRGEVRLLQPQKRSYNVDHVVVTRRQTHTDPKTTLFLDALKASLD